MDDKKNFRLNLYPVRKKHLCIHTTKYGNKIMDFWQGGSDSISVQSAFLLEHFTGEYNVKTIIKIIKETFSLPKEEAERIVYSNLDKYSEGIEYNEYSSSVRTDCDPVKVLQIEKIDLEKAKKRSEKINQLIVYLTGYCNHRCSYCSNNSETSYENELTGDEWIGIIDKASEMGAKGIKLSGGEPMAHPDFFEILEHAVRKGIYPMVYSNGTYLTEKKARLMSELGVDFIHLSLPSVEESVYERVVGKKDNLSKVLSSIEYLKKYGFYIRVKMVIVPDNVDGVRDLLNRCLESKVDFVHLEPYRLTHIGRNGKELIVPDDKLETIKEMVDREYNRFDGNMIIGGPSAGDLSWSGVQDIVRCAGIKSKLVILPDGNIVLCESIGNHPDFVLGNVREKRLDEIWCSSIPDEINNLDFKRLEEPCISCEYVNSCKTGCFMYSLIYSDNPWSIDPRCWKANIKENAFNKGKNYV